jgi:HD-GYP domain-containing protein (c-di-GMP phosphodiesterase class II)
MIAAPSHIKPASLLRQFELARPLLPATCAAALWFGGKCLAATNGMGESLPPDTPDIQAFALKLEGARIGFLFLRPDGDSEEIARAWGECVSHALQELIDAMHTRRSVAREALENYRELALLQRAVNDLNHSLKPAAVAAALLREFNGRRDATDFGAVFLHQTDGGTPVLIESFGEGSAHAFARLAEGRLFEDMVAREGGDIVSDLCTAPLWAGEAAELGSLLWLPLIAHGERLGLLVLASRKTGSFSAGDMKRAHTLASVAATALRNAQLYAAEQAMFQSFVRVIATAIDAKSPYTAGHCRRVPEIALMIAERAHRADNGALAAFALDENERNAMEIAAMLHDCGKVVTPEWVVDKATKLDAIVNRLDLVAMRFEVLRRDARIDRSRALAEGVEAESAETVYQERLRQLDDDLAFLEKCNTGGEFISDEHVARIHGIAGERWHDAQGGTHPLLSENEVYNLCTPRGTLNPEERKIIEDHAVHTINMLSQIAFPRPLRNVTEYAAGHHERMDGRGYPRGLKREDLSIPARIIAIADIFEALTAPDRPYRKPGTLNWAIGVMHRMKQDNHIDGELFDLFLSERVFMAYAEKHLAPEQIDDVDIRRYLG